MEKVYQLMFQNSKYLMHLIIGKLNSVFFMQISIAGSIVYICHYSEAEI